MCRSLAMTESVVIARRVPFLSFSIIHVSFSIRAKRALRAPKSVKIRRHPAQSVVKNAFPRLNRYDSLTSPFIFCRLPLY
jgi:hypothetical protein